MREKSGDRLIRKTSDQIMTKKSFDDDYDKSNFTRQSNKALTHFSIKGIEIVESGQNDSFKASRKSNLKGR